MTSTAAPAYTTVSLESQVSTVRSGPRTFLVMTLPGELITMVFEWKPSRGARPGAYVSRRTTPIMEPEQAVSGLLLGNPEPDPLEVADLEIQRSRRAWAAEKRELDRLRAQVQRLVVTKKTSRRTKPHSRKA